MTARRSTKRSPLAGMTLVEAMVSVAILSIVSVLVFGGFSQTMRNKARVEAQGDRAHVIRVAMERMCREIQSAFVSLDVNVSPQLASMRTVFHGRHEGRGSRLDFTSFSHRRLYRDAHESDQNELGYFLAEHRDDETRETHRVLVRRESRRIDDDPETGGQQMILVDDVREFELDYFDPVSLQWVDGWDTAGTEMNRLPAQVRIHLVVPALGNPRHDETYVTRVAVPITYALNHALYNP
ncbi:MAG: type II secretion system protein GspJ [Sandaracinus sp.]